ncbi:MAG: thiamine pyrophosphate-dependent dehydrogenase E1 component subunit alpha [Pseudomonadota bacterium]
MNQTNLNVTRLSSQLHSMYRVRAFEQRAVEALQSGDVPGPLHPSIGQEACAVAIVGSVERDDILLSTHRGHGHTLVKGADPEAMMRELLGKAGGCCGGKGGSMHIADFDVGMLGANGVVGANLLIAAGAAHALDLLGESRIVLNIFGDGAINRGPFLEALNWAQIYKLPVLFVCEDNRFAATTRSATTTAGDGPVARAEALGIPAEQADGNDLLALEETAARLVGEVRGGQGPRLLHAVTYRLTGHTAADAAPYRDAAEVDAKWRDDPIARTRTLLGGAGVSEAELDSLAARADAEMSAALTAARAAGYPPVSEAFSDVQDLDAAMTAPGGSSV